MNSARKPKLLRIVKTLALCLGAAFLLVATYLSIERIRGAIALKRHRSHLAATGERLELTALRPKTAASNDNAAPLLLTITNELKQASRLMELSPPALRMAAPGTAVIAWQLTEWPADKKTNTWKTVGTNIVIASNILALLHLAAEKPVFDSGFDYEHGFIDFQTGPLIEVKRAAQLLSIATIYHLHRGEAEEAHRHLLPLIRLSNQRTEPLVIWQLVRHACAILAINCTWQFLQHPSITDTQLRDLQLALDQGDFPADMASSFEVERAMAADFFRQIKSSPRVRDQVLRQRDGWDLPFNSLATSGWMLHHVNAPLWRFAWADQDELRMWHRWQGAIQMERQARSNGWVSITPTQAHASEDELSAALSILTGETDETWWNRFRFLFSSSTFGVTDLMVRKTLAIQTYQNMAIAAVALKRSQLRFGEVPTDIEQLVPDLLSGIPRDEMNHQPLNYKRLTSGTFLLYSVGENGADDGGDATPLTKKTFRQIWDGRDGVWPVAASPAEADKAMRRRN